MHMQQLSRACSIRGRERLPMTRLSYLRALDLRRSSEHLRSFLRLYAVYLHSQNTILANKCRFIATTPVKQLPQAEEYWWRDWRLTLQTSATPAS